MWTFQLFSPFHSVVGLLVCFTNSLVGLSLGVISSDGVCELVGLWLALPFQTIEGTSFSVSVLVDVTGLR
jgi:hypothetical protein